MLDEAKARAFYIGYLGFELDWEHRFDQTSPDSPLYAQVRLGDAVLHIDGHAEEDVPVAEVRIPVAKLADFCDHLRSKHPDGDGPEIADPRDQGEGTDLNLYDPSGNLLVFWRELATR